MRDKFVLMMLLLAGVHAARDPHPPAAGSRLSPSSAAAAHELEGGAAAAKREFLRIYRQQYGYGGWLDKHWHREIGSRFGPGMRHYLDYTGASLYTTSSLRAAHALLECHTFSNPHSRNPSSLAAEREIMQARQQVLRFFNADPEEYTVVWTSGATAALKLVGEFFPFSAAPSWQPDRHPRPGGYSDTEVGHATPCGDVSAAAAGSQTPPASQFVYLRSNHKSVLGIGAYARARGAALSCVDEAGMEAWLDSSSTSTSTSSKGQATAQRSAARAALSEHSSSAEPDLKAHLAPAAEMQVADDDIRAGLAEHLSSDQVDGMLLTHSQQQAQADQAAAAAAAAAGGNHPQQVTFSLVAYPSKDNYEGRLYSLDWIKNIHAKSTPSHRWLVVLDAAAYVPTHPLDLSAVKPDFVPVSWYKVFGAPTGLGALIARKESLLLLRKYYFGGGSVVESTAEDVWRVLMPPPDGYEDGTVNFLSIAQLQFGFAQLQELGGIKAVKLHVQSLQLWLYAELAALRHGNGQSLVKLFGQHHLQDPGKQSCIFQMLVLKPDGSPVSSSRVEQQAAAEGIGIREGCMCNPSQCNFDLGITPEEKRAQILNNTDVSSGFLTVWRPDPDGAPGSMRQVQLPVGSVRVSLGYLSTFEDVYAFVQFLSRNYRVKSEATAVLSAPGAKEAAVATTSR